MITILQPEDVETWLRGSYVETWLRGSYNEAVALQRPYDAAKMTVRGPVFPTRCDEK